MFKNQFALGLKGMINKISSDKKDKDNDINNTNKNERSASVSSEPQLSSTLNNSNNSNDNQSEDINNDYLIDGQEVEGFLCPLCLRAFPSPESLSEHYSSEHSDFSNGFQCNECKMKFGSEQELDSHKRRHHSTNVSTDEMIRHEFSKISSVIESEELELLRAQINAVEESKQLITNECKTLREQLKRSEEEMRDIENELTQLRATNDESDSNILKKELVKVQKLMNDMSVEREKEKELSAIEMKKQMENVINERINVNKELDHLKIEHKQAVNDLIDMRSKKEKLEVELNLLRNEGLTVSSLRDDIENKCALIGKLEQNVEILSNQLERLKKELIETQKERDNLRDETLIKKELETQINELKERTEKRIKENIELNVMVSQLKSQLESVSSQYESLNIKMKVQEEMKTVGEQLDSKLIQEMELLKIDLMTAQQNLETSSISFNKASEELKLIKNLNKTLKEENEELIKKINLEKSESQNVIKNLLKQKNLLENEIKMIQKEFENFRIAEKQITSKYNEEKEKLKEITNQLILKEKLFEDILKQKENSELEIKRLEEVIENLNGEKQLLLNNYELIESENKNIKKNCIEIEDKLSFIEKDKNLLNEQLLKLSKTLTNNELEYKNNLAQKNDAISDLSKKVIDFDKIFNENNSLSIKLSELEMKSTEKLETYELELIEKSKVIDSQLKSISILNEKLISCENETKLNETKIDSLKNDKISLEELLQNHELKYIKLNEDYEQKCDQLEKTEIEMISINELLKSKDLFLSNIEIKLQNVEKELENSKQFNDNMKSSLIETQTIVENQKQEIENLRELLKNTEKIKNDLSMQLKSKTEEFKLKDSDNASKFQLLNGEIIKLRAGIEKEKSKQENYQTLNEQLLGVKLELTAKLSNLNEEKRALIERCINSEEECKKLKNEVLQMRHKMDESIAALHELGRENQCLQIEQTKLINRRWAEDNEAIGCAKCQKAFSVTNRKHHCRNCGQIFCNECSAKTALMALHPKPVRVCDNCHQEMNKK